MRDQPLKILVIVCEPSDLPEVPGIHEELQRILDSLHRLQVDSGVETVDVVRHCSQRSLLRKLRERPYDILHFIGHGVFERDRGYLFFESEDGTSDPVDGETLSCYFLERSLRLLVLNACETARSSKTDPMLGVGQAAIISGHIPAVIAMQQAVAGDVAVRFAEEFYLAIAEGCSLEAAMAEGRKAIMGCTTLDRADWAIPVLFSNADTGVLLQRRSKGSREEQRSSFDYVPLGSMRETPRSPEQESKRQSAARIPHNLTKRDPLLLIGRSRELSRVMDTLRSVSAATVIQLTGLGGVGRSTLAQEAAWRSLEESLEDPVSPASFKAVVWVAPHGHESGRVDMRPGESRPSWALDEVLLTIADVLGSKELRQASPLERKSMLRDLLRGQPLLLVLDDADEMSTVDLRYLMAGLETGSKVLLTSRTSLLEEGLQISLGGLDEVDAIALVRREAAAAQVPAIQDASEQEIRELVDKADYLPLVLHWAVGELCDSGQSLSWLVERLEVAARDRLAEHCVAQSATRLTEVERWLLFACALLPQPLSATTLGRAGAADGGTLNSALTRLEQLCLVSHDADRGLYRCLRLVRQYTLSELVAGRDSLARARDRAIDAMCELVTRATFGDDSAHELQLEWQLGNLMWAARAAHAHERWQDLIELCDRIKDPLYFRGHWNESITVGELAFDAAQRLDQPLRGAWCALYPLTRIYLQRGNLSQAEEWCDEALNLFSKAGDVRGIAEAERSLGRLHLSRGQRSAGHRAWSHFAKAEALFRVALTKIRGLAQAAVKPVSEEKLLNQEGDLVSSLAGTAELRSQLEGADREEELDAARRGYGQALELYRQVGNKNAILTMLHHLGSTAIGRGETDEAARLLGASLDMAREVGWLNREAKILYSLAQLEEMRGAYEEALGLLEEAHGHFLELSSAPDLARSAAARTRVLAALAYAGRPRTHA